VGELRGNIYGPVRAANAHAALRDLPIRDFSQYTFLDIGSGKGRVLFIAAEYPFRRIIGVEYATDMHELALENLRRYKHRKQRCADIQSVSANAAEFEFPNENLVLYLFNPFGPEIMQRMLANLQRSLESDPRHVVIVMLWPEQSSVVEQMPAMHVYKKTRRYHIYQTVPFRNDADRGLREAGNGKSGPS
jgi:SAM-dependent methyltransferase